MATHNSTPTVARLIVATTRALELYQAGDLPAALAALDGIEADPLPDRPEWIATQLERYHAAGLAGQPVPGAARDCIALARDRIRKELGEPVQFAVMPVPLALRTALGCLGAGS
jgi:hypothetical protein